jgi:hypothetical protein
VQDPLRSAEVADADDRAGVLAHQAHPRADLALDDHGHRFRCSRTHLVGTESGEGERRPVAHHHDIGTEDQDAPAPLAHRHLCAGQIRVRTDDGERHRHARQGLLPHALHEVTEEHLDLTQFLPGGTGGDLAHGPDEHLTQLLLQVHPSHPPAPTLNAPRYVQVPHLGMTDSARPSDVREGPRYSGRSPGPGGPRHPPSHSGAPAVGPHPPPGGPVRLEKGPHPSRGALHRPGNRTVTAPRSSRQTICLDEGVGLACCHGEQLEVGN